MSKTPTMPPPIPQPDQPESPIPPPGDTQAEQQWLEKQRLQRNARHRELYHQRRQGLNARQEILTARQQRFIDEYLKLGVATEAARRAGYAIAPGSSCSSHLLRIPHIARIIAENRAAAQRRTEVTMDRVIGELAKLAFADPRDLFTANGRLKPIHALDDASAASIAALEVLVVASGPRSAAARAAKAAQPAGAAKAAQASAGAASDGGTESDATSSESGDLALELRKIKRWDKTKALELLGRYLGLFKDRVELGVSQDLASAIEAARRRAQSAAVPESHGVAQRPVIDVDTPDADAPDAVAPDAVARGGEG
jgi:hypothetical protein